MVKKKILVIEDEKEMAKLLEIELMSENYQVLLVYEGKSGLELLRKEKPDMVVLDVMLPEMDGYQVLDTIRKDPALKNTPVVMLTAKGLEEEIQKGLDLGADDVVAKPFHPGLFIKRIKNILNGKNGQT